MAALQKEAENTETRCRAVGLAAAPSPSPSTLPSPHAAARAENLNALLHMPACMELSQIELIYRAEGNANLVLALPQFKKVLRLPKMISNRQEAQGSRQQAEPETKQQQQQGLPNVSVKTEPSPEKAGDLTMPDFMAYIEIMRRLLGNEFVCEADIVAIPKESDRFWINEHIRAARPTARLDKEFVGQFGLLLPDVTQLPATFDVLLANLQANDEQAAAAVATMLGDTYAIEIKPKQGWMMLPSDVSDLFDLMPAGSSTTAQQTTMSAHATPAVPLPTDTVTVTAAKLTKRACSCRYCSMQLLKLRNAKIERLSSYCPMDLFSGAPRRMLDALNALFACPQNNLRVFQNGNLIYGDHANSISCQELQARIFPGARMELIKQLLVACLLREYDSPKMPHDTAPSQTKAEAANVATETATVAVASPLVQSNEKTRQRCTKQSDTTMAAATTATTTTTTTAAKSTTTAATNVAKAETEALATQTQINKPEIQRLPKNCVLQKILHLQLLVKRHLAGMRQAGHAARPAHSYNALAALLDRRQSCIDAEQLAAEQAYMLGATALDCSIMLTFQEIKWRNGSVDVVAAAAAASLQPWLVQLPAGPSHFLTKVSVLDLDPKPDSHFHKFVKQTNEMLKCYTVYSADR